MIFLLESYYNVHVVRAKSEKDARLLLYKSEENELGKDYLDSEETSCRVIFFEGEDEIIEKISLEY